MTAPLFAHNFTIDAEARAALFKHKPLLIWFTGLSGSGKSTLADALEVELYKNKVHTCILDGDSVRTGLNAGLGFSPEDRKENIRRIAEVSRLMLDAGLVVLASFVSPHRRDREAARQTAGPGRFFEVFVSTPLEECERRDVKGLYKKARAGTIPNFTGISAPYEVPENPDLVLDTSRITVEEAVSELLEKIKNRIGLPVQ